MEHLWRNPVPAPDDVQRRIDMWRGLGGLLVCAVFTVDAWHWQASFLPIWLMNMAVHESGHAIFGAITHNELIMLMMGNGWESLFPLIVGVWFLARRRNWVAFAICMAWVADTLVGAAIYINDAPLGNLPLIGIGSRADAGTAQLGDWARVLGPEHFDKLFLAAPIARDVRHVAVFFTLLAFGALAFGLIQNQRKLRELERGPKPTTKLETVPLPPVSQEQMWR
jgi:hypothetical protein